MNQEERRLANWKDWAGICEKRGEFTTYMIGTGDPQEASAITAGDIQDVMEDFLPDLSGMTVLELASGVGRFTKELAKRAKHVTCVEMMEMFVEENKKTNGAVFSNITFVCMDATKISYQPETFDLLFVFWLLAYLSDEECKCFLNKALKILKPGKYLLFRDTHFTSSLRDIDKTTNSAFYRSIREYHNFITNATYTDANGDHYCFKHIKSITSKTYTRLRKLPTLCCHLYVKCRVGERDVKQSELDKNVYNDECFQVYDTIIKDGFTMPGGLEAAKKWLSSVNIQTGSDILDIGCGTGGLQAYLMQEFDADVTALDLSVLASEKSILQLASLQKTKGSVVISDAASADFTPNAFDYIFVKESLKCASRTLLNKLKTWLKPGGVLVMGGYFGGRIDNDTAALGDKYTGDLDLLVSDLGVCGFSQISTLDLSNDFVGYVEAELTKLSNDQKISTDVKQRFTNLWSEMLSSLKSQQMQWVSVTAVVML